MTLDVDKSMTVPPGDVGGPPFICAWVVVIHFTERLIAENPVGIAPVPVSYWYIGLEQNNNIFIYINFR